MTEKPTAAKRRFRFWITLSELVGVLAVLIAGLNFWDSHRERVRDAKQAAAAEHAASGRSAFVVSAQMVADGARLTFRPLDPAQAIQDERYIFPRAVLGHEMEVSAASPQIDCDWIQDGLRAQVARLRKAGAGSDGEGTIPVGVVATYVQDGDMHVDRSLYRLGYAWRGRLFGGPRLALQGVSLIRRAIPGDLGGAVETAWVRETGAPPRP